MKTATTTQPEYRRTHVRWVILALLFMASFVAYMLRTNMSIAGESIMADVGLSKIQLGMVLSAFAWGYAIFQFPGGVFGNRVGSRRSLTLIALLWGILTLVTGLVPGTTYASTFFILITFIGLRFLMGVASAIVSGGLWWNDWQLVSSLRMGISERIGNGK